MVRYITLGIIVYSMRSKNMLNDLFNNSQNIAFDIETEGFNAASGDEITVIGFEPDCDNTLFLINGESYDNVEEELKETDLDADFIVFESEKEMLKTGLGRVIDNMSTNHHRLYAYNGKTWKGGFDVPFIRTRIIMNDIDWCLDGVYYFDVYPEIKDDINTSIETEDGSSEMNDLDSVHNIIFDDKYGDPFEDSSEALNATVGDVVKHCYSDIKRTQDLFNLIIDYTPAREVKELRESGYL